MARVPGGIPRKYNYFKGLCPKGEVGQRPPAGAGGRRRGGEDQASPVLSSSKRFQR